MEVVIWSHEFVIFYWNHIFKTRFQYKIEGFIKIENNNNNNTQLFGNNNNNNKFIKKS